MTIGLALPGEGQRSFFSLGLLEGLTEQQIPLDFLSGVGAGGLIAGLFSTGVPLAACADFLKEYYSNQAAVKAKKGKKAKKEAEKIDTERFEALLLDIEARLAGGIKTNPPALSGGLAIPFTEADSGRTVWFVSREETLQPRPDCIYVTRAPFLEVLALSLFLEEQGAVLRRFDRTLISAGARIPLPVDILRLMGAKRVLACGLRAPLPPLKKGQNTCERRFQLAREELFKSLMARADLVLGGRGEDEAADADQLIMAGRAAAEKEGEAVRAFLMA